MIAWIDDIGKDWGRYLRRNPTGPDHVDSGYPSTSVMGRIREEGSVGAAIRSHIQVIPVKDMPSDLLEFHRAWDVLQPRYKRVVYVQYVAVCPLYEKLEFLDLKKTTFYQCLSKAQAELWSLMEVQNGVRKVREVQKVPEQVC